MRKTEWNPNLSAYHPLYSQEQPQKLLRAKQLRRPLAEAERILWSRLQANRCCVYHFRKKQVIAGSIVDFYCHQARWIIEVDSDIHASQKVYDAERDNILRNQGMRILRFSNQQIKMHLRHTMLTIFRSLERSMP